MGLGLDQDGAGDKRDTEGNRQRPVAGVAVVQTPTHQGAESECDEEGDKVHWSDVIARGSASMCLSQNVRELRLYADALILGR